MNEFSRVINAILIIILSIILVGAIVFQYYYKEIPCPLCLIQRVAMVGIISGSLLNIRFGIRIRHYVVSYISALIGIAASIRQIMLHICPNDAYMGGHIFGLHLYTWSFIIFICSIVAISILLFLYKPKENLEIPNKMGIFSTVAFVLAFLICVIHVFVTWLSCGIGTC